MIGDWSFKHICNIYFHVIVFETERIINIYLIDQVQRENAILLSIALLWNEILTNTYLAYIASCVFFNPLAL